MAASGDDVRRAARQARFAESDLYVVITGQFCGGRDALAVLDACLDAGVRLVQFREKGPSDRACHAAARAFRKHTRDAGALLIVNDRVDLALAVEADGVHLGQDDLPLEAARRLAPGLLLGVSSHGLEEALAAQAAGADYINIGPIFDTQTKTAAGGAIGPGALAEIAPRLTIPFTCMGGIKAGNIAQVLAQGARHVAVVTAVTAAGDVRAAAAELREAILAGRIV